GKTPGLTPGRHDRSPRGTTPSKRHRPTRLRRTFRPVGRTAVALENQPLVGRSPEEGSVEDRQRDTRRHQLPSFPGTQTSANRTIARLRMDPRTSQLHHHRTYWYREKLLSLCPGPPSLPRWPACSILLRA